jgi:hypothetical protein
MSINPPPKFEQSIDTTRPHTLLTKNTQSSGSLVYRYDDTLENISVPSIWYNQPYQDRVAFVRWQAELEDERAAKLKKSPPYNMVPARVNELILRHDARATQIRSEAARMLAAGDDRFPVAASLLQLDYGPNVH